MITIAAQLKHQIADYHLLGAIKRLEQGAKAYLDDAAIQKLTNACVFGAKAHSHQIRRSGELYIYHPIAVAQTLIEFNFDVDTLVAAVLHDTVEDTDVTYEDLEKEFGTDVAELVDGVTKIGQIKLPGKGFDKEQAEADSLRKMLLAMSKDIRVMLIKLADRLHNMQTLSSLRQEKQARIATQTLEIFAPIANRLGLYHWTRQLEDLSFEILYPKRYAAIKKEMVTQDAERTQLMERVSGAIYDLLKEHGIESRTMGRKKGIYRIYQDMHKERSKFDDIKDINAVYLVVKNTDACYRSLGLIHSIYKPIIGRFKDYIAIPKINGYQSLHTTTFGPFGSPFEVQIRTEAMHAINEIGVASHWNTNIGECTKGDKIELPQINARQWLIDFLDTQKQAGNPAEFLEHLKSDLFPDEVYIFTPKGEIKRLPKGATALDFAYSVHSDVGNHCSEARINGVTQPLYHQLKSGDNVRIITDKERGASPMWLNYVRTARARATIRSGLKKRNQHDAIKIGERLLNQQLHCHHIDAISDEQKSQLLQRYELQTWDELLADIGLGNRLPIVIVNQLNKEGHDLKSSNDDAIIIDSADSTAINLAKCCHPIPGDTIVGYFAENKGIIVHTQDCRNYAEFKKTPNNVLYLKWDANPQGLFTVPITINTRNKPGVLAALTTAIAANGANIIQINIRDRDGTNSSFHLEIEVNNREQLARIMRSIRHQDGIIKISRDK